MLLLSWSCHTFWDVVPSCLARLELLTHPLNHPHNSTPYSNISIKLQQEERERRDNYVPEVSALDLDVITVDPDTKQMLSDMDFRDVKGVHVQEVTQAGTGVQTYRRRNDRQ